MGNERESVKRRIFEIIEASRDRDMASHAYDIMMFFAIIVGLIPLTMKSENPYTRWIDLVTAILFLFDYMSRLWTADYKMGYKHYKAYLAYLISPLAIVDLLSVIPILALFFPANTTIGLFRLFRLFRVLRVIIVLKFIRYSKTWISIMNVFRRVKKQLVAVIILLFVYIISVAMLMFQVEPDLFETFFDAVYWATVSITTIGYGDYTPNSEIGKFVTILSSLVGVAVIALPTGIITAAYTNEITRKKGKHEL